MRRRRPGGPAVLLGAALLLAGACTGSHPAGLPAPPAVSSPGSPPATAAPGPSPAATPVLAPPTPRPVAPAPSAVESGVSATALAPGESDVTFADSLPAEAVEIDGAGDVTLGDVIGDLVAANGPSWPWQYVTPALKRADISYVNFEGTASARGTAEDKTYTFRGDPAALRAMGEAGVVVASVANNHSLDFGPDALLDTIDGLTSAGIAPVGAGVNDTHAYEPLVLTRKGMRVAFIAATRILPPGWAATATTPGVASAYNERRLLQAVAEARSRADFVVVAVHWGTEGATAAGPEQVHLAHALINAGVGLVLGGHPHVVQPVVTYKGGIIAYSLGNLVFTGSELVQATIILRVGVLPGGGLVAAKVPVRIVGGQPRPDRS